MVDNIVIALTGLAGVSCAEGSFMRAAKLLSSSKKLSGDSFERWHPADHMEYEKIFKKVQTQLDQGTLLRAERVGRALTMEQAIELALSV